MVAITGSVRTSGLSDAGCVYADSTSVALAIANLHHWIYARAAALPCAMWCMAVVSLATTPAEYALS